MVNYDSAFTFIYSKRKGTPAANHIDQVSNEDKHKHFEKMLNIFNKTVIKKNKTRMNNVYEVLVEGYTKKSDEYLFGRSRENLLVTFKGDESLIGEIVNIKISNPKNFSLEGEIINTSI